MATLAKPNLPRFDVEIFQNEYLADGAREVNAIVTVTATGGGTSGGRPLGITDAPAGGDGQSAAVVILVDCSGSMDYPSSKMRGAREATAAAVDTVRDGVAFAVVAGTHEAREVFPGDGTLAIASPETRARARESLRRLTAAGGTAMGTWLTKADQLFLTRRDIPIRHAILLTDGNNEHETAAELERAIGRVTGHFTADCRGVGTDWKVEELRKIASALLGTVDIVPEPSGLAEDFRSMMTGAMGKQVADVALRVWTPANAVVKFVKQVAPALEDLTGRRAEAGPRAGDYPTGSWGDESRDYHVCVEVPAAAVGNEMLAARISLVLPPSVAGGRPRCCPRVWSRRSGPTTSPHPPGSARRSPTTPGRRNSPRRSRKAWRRTAPGTSTSPPRSWAPPSGSPTRPGTTAPTSCCRRWWTWWTRRRVPFGSVRT